MIDLGNWLTHAPRELGLTGALFFAALALGFVALDRITGGGKFDQTLLLVSRTPDDLADPIGPRQFEEAVRDITALGSFAVLTLVTLAAVGFLIALRKNAEAAMVAFAALGGQALSEGLKALFDRPRPDLVAQIVDTTSASLPSGHATMSAAIYLTLGAMLARVQQRQNAKTYIHAAAVLLTLLVGASRVYLGVHWPSDVLAGWRLGALWAILCWSALAWLTRGRGDAPAASP